MVAGRIQYKVLVGRWGTHFEIETIAKKSPKSST